VVKAINTLSDWVVRGERGFVRVAVLALPVMILANVIGRALRSPIYWMDELAVLTMVWLAMVGLSLTLKTRDAVAVTMLQDAVAPALVKLLRIAVDLITLGFGLALLYLCYLWFDPLLLMQVNFNLADFAAETFNFMYEEPTATLGIKKFWFWLVVPIAALTTSIHALANLLNTLAEPAAAVAAEREAASAAGAE
jgi:TRAP-type C4-dicarboxylate transport system permease small subunit